MVSGKNGGNADWRNATRENADSANADWEMLTQRNAD
jgi:uncharacterized protein YjbI with pentapeptide repeats